MTDEEPDYLGPDGVEPPAADHEAYLTACIRLWSTAERMVADVGARIGAANTRA